MIPFIEMIKVNMSESPIGPLLFMLLVLAVISQILQRNKIDVWKSLFIILNTANKLSKVNKIILLPASITS